MSRQKRNRRNSNSATALETRAAQLDPNDLPPNIGKPQLSNSRINVVHQVERHEHWEAPIPPPELLLQYKDVLEDAPERILRMAEQEGEHTRHCQKVAVWGTLFGQTVGQLFAAGLAVACLLGSFKLAMNGHDGVATVLGGGTLTTVVVSFLQARKKPQPNSQTVAKPK